MRHEIASFLKLEMFPFFPSEAQSKLLMYFLILIKKVEKVFTNRIG